MIHMLRFGTDICCSGCPFWRTWIWSLPDHSRLQSGGDVQGLVDVVGEHSRRQAVACGVCSLDHFMDATETHDLLHRAKNLRVCEQKEISSGIVCASVNVCSGAELCRCSTSSLAMRISSVTLEKTVGWMKSPCWPQADPPHSSVAPSLFPLSISSIILLNCLWSICRKQRLRSLYLWT